MLVDQLETLEQGSSERIFGTPEDSRGRGQPRTCPHGEEVSFDENDGRPALAGCDGLVSSSPLSFPPFSRARTGVQVLSRAFPRLLALPCLALLSAEPSCLPASWAA